MTLLLVFFVMLYSSAPPSSLEDQRLIQKREPAGPAMDGDRPVGERPERHVKMPVVDDMADDAGKRQPAAPVAEVPVAKPAEAPQGDETMSRQIMAGLEDRFSKDFYVRWEDRQPVIVLGERITFNAGEAILLVEAQDALRRVAGLIGHHGDCQVVVTGHTDDRPIHTNAFPSNWELSAARAASVAKVLMESGVSPGQLVIQGQSQYSPLVPNMTEEDRRSNRRVEISLISD
jgi:chemotaxis protein MotB